jgi:putrescine transport system substrate-binding protein
MAVLLASCDRDGDQAGTAGGAEEPVVNIYNWSDYIDEETIPGFENETGIKVRYDVFDSNEVVEAKLLAGNSGYDIVVPSASFLERQIKAGVFRPIDKDGLENYGNLDEDILQRVALHDPANAHAVPYMWGTTGIGYNVEQVAKAMPDAPTGSWKMMLDPDTVKTFQSCGVTVLDDPAEVFAITRHYLELDPNSDDEGDLQKAEEHLMKIRPFVRYFHSSRQIDDLANGEICMAMGYSGDMFIARDRAAEAENALEIEYVIPEEGTIIWFDMMAIPADAPHPNNAHAFIDYILRPETAAAISNYVFYANPNAASLEFVDDEVKNDPAIYPTEEVKSRLFPDLADSPEYTRLENRAWTRVKTGQ